MVRGAERVRAAVLGTAVTILTVAGHAAAAAQAPSPIQLGIVWIVATALCASAFRVRRSLPLTIALLVGLQFLGHLLMSVSGHAGHDAGLVPTGAMAAFHAAAAIIAALVVAYADDLAARWARLLAPLVQPALVRPALPALRRSMPVRERVPSIRRSACVATDAGRAPPRFG